MLSDIVQGVLLKQLGKSHFQNHHTIKILQQLSIQICFLLSTEVLMVTKSVLYLQLVCSNPDLNFLLITVLLFAPGSTCSLLINCHLKGCCRVSRSFCYPHILTCDENFKVFRLTIVLVVFMRTLANCNHQTIFL